jgi:hypothetical protein
LRSKCLHLALAIALTSQLGATDGGGGCGGGGQVTRDPGFDLWCGEELCSWKVLRGEVERAATWHEKDSGVRLLGTDSAIGQLTPVDSGDGTCILFSLLADVSDRAEAALDLDIGGDGSIEHSERFSTGAWHPLKYALNIQPPYRGIRFIIRKAGTGTAVVAQIDADIVDDAECEGFTPIAAAPAVNGVICDEGSDCISGQCLAIMDNDRACAGCDPTVTNSCGAGMVCAKSEPLSPVLDIPYECVSEGSEVLAAMCSVDEECASGFCVFGLCSSCETAASCGTAESCEAVYQSGPRVCAPGQGLRIAGEPCIRDNDCASGECMGVERFQCVDGRSCPTGDRSFCPPADANTLEPGECMLVGVEGGTCL